MKVLVGLGNPRDKYKNNRHNVGFMFVDYLAHNQGWKKSKYSNLLYSWINIDNQKVELIKPQSFMNKSGLSVAYLLKKHSELTLQDICVAHDDLDIPLGKFKIQRGEGPRLHNGLNSIEESLNTRDFWRIRIGVDNRNPNRSIDGEAYVLSDFLTEEKEILYNSIFPRIVRKFFI